MPKVLIISGSLPPIRCGVGYYTHRLASELRGVDISLLSTAGVKPKLKLPLLIVPDWRLRQLPKLLRRVDEASPEIVHIQYPAVGYQRQLGVNFLPYFLRLFKPKVKIVVTLHEYYGSGFLGRWRNLITIMPAHKIILSNNADLLALPKWLRDKSVVIPIGSNFNKSAINPQKYAHLVRSTKLDPKVPTLLFFGFAYPNKGLDYLLDAMDEPGLVNWQLLLMTSLSPEDAYHAQLLNRVERLNKGSPRVGVTGFLQENEISVALQEGKYFVLPQPSSISPKSSTAIAAIQHGLILVTEGAGKGELTKPYNHLENCYLVGGMNAESIAVAIGQLEGSADLRQKILGGVKILNNYFSWPKIVQKHLKLYEDL